MADISEREAFVGLVDRLTASREYCRTLALLRNEEEWIVVANLFDQIKDKAVKLMGRPHSARKSGLILPPRMN